jgi:hypothetical protein
MSTAAMYADSGAIPTVTVHNHTMQAGQRTEKRSSLVALCAARAGILVAPVLATLGGDQRKTIAIIAKATHVPAPPVFAVFLRKEEYE